MEYRLAYTSHLNLGEFEAEITSLMADGWRPSGGVATTTTKEGGEVLYQAMVREAPGVARDVWPSPVAHKPEVLMAAALLTRSALLRRCPVASPESAQAYEDATRATESLDLPDGVAAVELAERWLGLA